MTKYIERDKAVKLIFLAADTGRAANALSLLGKESVADVAPVVHATTTDAGWDEIYCEWKTCNHCQSDNVSTAIYCNWCGARMDGEE